MRKLTLMGVEVVLLFEQEAQTCRVRVRMSKSKHIVMGEFEDQGEEGGRLAVAN